MPPPPFRLNGGVVTARPHLSSLSLVLLAGLEGDLQHTVTKAVAVKAGNGHSRLIVVGHGDEAKALAFVGSEVTDDLDIGDCTERPKQLPQNTLISLRREVVDKDAPAGTSGARQVYARQRGHAVDGDGGEPGEERWTTTMGVILKFHAACSSLLSYSCSFVLFLISTPSGLDSRSSSPLPARKIKNGERKGKEKKTEHCFAL